MSEHNQDTGEHVNYYQAAGWVSPQDGLAAAYSTDKNGITRLDAVIQYAPITAKTLRNIPLRALENPRDYEDTADWLTFPPGPPPTNDELAAAWQETQDEETDTIKTIFGGHLPTPEPPTGPVMNAEWLTKKPGEPAEDFYQRIAAAYTEYSESTNKPVRHLAYVAGVSDNTAHSWVHRARKHGFLPAKGTQA